MSAQRIKGQEVQVICMVGAELQDALTDIVNFNATFKLSKLEQGYIGETANRFDEKYDGCELDFEMHVHSAQWDGYLQSIVDRARRRTPDVTFNVVATLFYPSGETRAVTFNDIKFGDMPMNIGTRGDYVKLKVQASCTEFVWQ